MTATATAELREGSEVIADAMVAAGCRFFSGYPMTPFTEVLEHMAAKLSGVGGTCMNAESELEAVGMAWGVDMVVDEALEASDVIYMEAGDHESLLQMAHEDFHMLMRGAAHGKISRRTMH